MSYCRYTPAWSSACGTECEGEICAAHADRKCVSCNAPATNECNHAGQFVCGYPLCDNCEGYVDTTKSGGSWGFMNHGHRAK